MQGRFEYLRLGLFRQLTATRDENSRLKPLPQSGLVVYVPAVGAASAANSQHIDQIESTR